MWIKMKVSKEQRIKRDKNKWPLDRPCTDTINPEHLPCFSLHQTISTSPFQSLSEMELSFLILLICSLFSLSHSQKYNAIFSFGDSISDTGNMCTGGGGCPSWLTTGQPPYGQTFFGKPTGRCTDGRVIIDYMGINLSSNKLIIF